MSFKSTSVEVASKDSLKVTGNLTIRDKTKKITVLVKYKGTVEAWDQKRAAFKAEFEIDRKAYGLGWNDFIEAGPVVGNTVAVELVIQGGT